jgi:hypothetical protein
MARPDEKGGYGALRWGDEAARSHERSSLLHMLFPSLSFACFARNSRVRSNEGMHEGERGGNEREGERRREGEGGAPLDVEHHVGLGGRLVRVRPAAAERMGISADVIGLRIVCVFARAGVRAGDHPRSPPTRSRSARLRSP